MYALLGGFKKSTGFKSLDKMAWRALDGLKQENLKAVFQYYDGRTDDAALTRAVMHSAHKLGAESVILAEFVSAHIEPKKVQITYRENGNLKHCQANALVNATGPWINSTLKNIKPTTTEKKISLIQGSHLIIDNFPVSHCFYLEAPQDKRAVFLLPWKGKTLVGTTEADSHEALDELKPNQQEKDYLLDVARHYFPENDGLNVSDAFAGLRVLPSGQNGHFNKPRKTVLHRSHDRVINIYGGKLTTYRQVSLRVISDLQNVLPATRRIALTENVHLHPD